LDESAKSGDSEIEENEDQPELFDQVILRSGRLAKPIPSVKLEQ